MTALKKYQKLECPGLWRDSAQGQRREVVANLGDTSLVLSDPKQETALAHWSLPAVKRLNPGERPAIYAPGADDDGEVLELEDNDMISALETVHAALRAARPRPGRVRNVILATLLLGVIGVSVFWLPDALVQHTASFLPRTTREDIGRIALADLTRLTGQPCTATSGKAALKTLSNRLFGEQAGVSLVVVRSGIDRALHLPGRLIILPEALLAEQDGPDIAAGFAIAERAAAETDDPMIPLLHHAGLRATFRLLTTGFLPREALAGYAETLIKTPMPHLAEKHLLARFEAAGLPSTPFAYAVDPSGERTLSLIEGDPFANVAPPPILPDGEWVSLQDICTR